MAYFVPAFLAGYFAFAGPRHKCQTSDFIRNMPSSIFVVALVKVPKGFF